MQTSNIRFTSAPVQTESAKTLKAMVINGKSVKVAITAPDANEAAKEPTPKKKAAKKVVKAKDVQPVKVQALAKVEPVKAEVMQPEKETSFQGVKGAKSMINILFVNGKSSYTAKVYFNEQITHNKVIGKAAFDLMEMIERKAFLIDTEQPFTVSMQFDNKFYKSENTLRIAKATPSAARKALAAMAGTISRDYNSFDIDIFNASDLSKQRRKEMRQIPTLLTKILAAPTPAKTPKAQKA